MKNCKLFSLPVNKEAIITNIIFEKNVSLRLMELGFIKGNKVKMIFVSPKEKTFIVEVMNSTMMIRKDALRLVEVEYE